MILKRREVDLDYNELTDISIIVAGQGSGKSMGIGDLIGSTLGLGSSNNLLGQHQIRFPQNFQLHLADEKGNIRKGELLKEYLNSDYCLDNLQSLHLWENSKLPFENLVIDEYPNFFKDLYLYTPNRYQEKNHAQLIWRMKSSERVILLGAHRSHYVEDFIERNIRRPFNIYEYKYEDLKGISAKFLNNSHELRTIIEEALENGKKVLLTTEYSDWLRNTIMPIWKERFPDKKIKLITAENKPSKDLLEILADPNKTSGIDLLICSPSMKEGFHIVNEFDLTVGDFFHGKYDILDGQEIMNAMLRSRDTKEHALLIKKGNSLEKSLNDEEILLEAKGELVYLPKNIRITDTETGDQIVKNEDIKIGTTFHRAQRKKNILERHIWLPEEYVRRGGNVIKNLQIPISKTIPKYKRSQNIEAMLKAKPIAPKDMLKPHSPERIKADEIRKLNNGQLDEYLIDRGNLKEVERKRSNRRRIENPQIYSTDNRSMKEQEVDKTVLEIMKGINNYQIGTDDNGEIYRLYLEAFLGSHMWKKLKNNRNQFNEALEIIFGTNRFNIEDKHLSLTSSACLDWLAEILKQYDYKVDCIDAKSVKQKKAQREVSTKEYRAQLKDWKLQGNKGRLENYLIYLLTKENRKLLELSKSARDFLDCYSYVEISNFEPSNNYFT